MADLELQDEQLRHLGPPYLRRSSVACSQPTTITNASRSSSTPDGPVQMTRRVCDPAVIAEAPVTAIVADVLGADVVTPVLA